MGAFFLLVAGLSAFGIYRTLKSHAAGQRYLEAAADEAALQLDHLPPRLAALVRDTRLLRIGLEGAVREAAYHVRHAFDTSEDFETYRHTLLDVSRQLSDWLTAVDNLPETDRATMADLGASPESVRAALANEGGAYEHRRQEPPGQRPIDERLAAVATQLGNIEAALQQPPSPYR